MWLLACADAPAPELHARWTGDGVEVSSTAPITTLEVRDAAGRPLVQRTLPRADTQAFLALEAAPGALEVRASGPSGAASAALTVTSAAPYVVEVQPAPGAPWQPAQGQVEVPIWSSSGAIFLRVTAGAAAVDLASDLGPVHLPAPGSRVLLPLDLDAPRTVHVGQSAVDLVPVRRDPADAHVSVAPLVFPADAQGKADAGRPAAAVVLPSPMWERALARLGLGVRTRAAEDPWSNVRVPVVNAGGEPLDVVVSAWVEDAAGDPAAAFRPRLRAADGGTDRVVALLRVPAHGEAAAVLPIFVDVGSVAAGPYRLRATVTPLGAASELAAAELPIAVRRGDPVASVGFGLTALASLCGWAWTLRALPRWLARASTTDQMVNALFGTALFVVSTATDVVAMTIGAVLGPFSSLFSGLLYDAGRTVLMATLLQLQPRPGTLALSIVCSWLGRAVLLGSIGLPDLVYTGAAIAIGESLAWVAGLTRGRAPTVPRVVVGFALSNAALTLCGLWLHTVLYRLSFASWYVAMQVAVPGFLYVAIAGWLAVPFARSLRRVDA